MGDILLMGGMRMYKIVKGPTYMGMLNSMISRKTVDIKIIKNSCRTTITCVVKNMSFLNENKSKQCTESISFTAELYDGRIIEGWYATSADGSRVEGEIEGY